MLSMWFGGIRCKTTRNFLSNCHYTPQKTVNIIVSIFHEHIYVSVNIVLCSDLKMCYTLFWNDFTWTNIKKMLETAEICRAYSYIRPSSQTECGGKSTPCLKKQELARNISTTAIITRGKTVGLVQVVRLSRSAKALRCLLDGIYCYTNGLIIDWLIWIKQVKLFSYFYLLDFLPQYSSPLTQKRTG